jgi:hypothetical protein
MLLAGIVCGLEFWIWHRSVPDTSPWVECHDSSVVHVDGLEWSLVQLRWRAGRLECACCVRILDAQNHAAPFDRPWGVVSCHFLDGNKTPLDQSDTVGVVPRMAFLLEEVLDEILVCQFDVPPSARYAAVQLGGPLWKTQFVKLPRRPTDILSRLLPS